MPRPLLMLLAGVLGCLGQAECAEPNLEPITFETTTFRLTFSREGRHLSFVDRATGRDWLRPGAPVPVASVRIGGRDLGADSVSWVDPILTLGFAGTTTRARLQVEKGPDRLVFKVEGLDGGDVEALTFLQIPLNLQAHPSEPFAACALALNLITRVDALPALQRDLKAAAEKPYGIVGAKVAVVAAPMNRLLPALQDALAQASELPVCRVAGPWARDIAFNHGSYLFNFGSLTETNVEDWITMTRSLGFTQIDNHGGGGFFRFGDMELNRAKWPDGWDAWTRIVARLHENGIGSIFHTYAFFIDKRSKYVTPVPDPRLDAFRTFTLTQPLSPDATQIEVKEPTVGMKTITGFFEHNSVLLHLDDELVSFSGVSQEAPWRFTGLQRGALGTRAAAHPAGTPARHLKECFGLLVPNPESTLFEEIAANHADVVNRCGFDGLYLDAIDGSSILRGGDACWYWANKFVVEIQKRLRKPVGMEMSAMWHQFWQYRTRWQAWDYPQRGHLRFIDQHAADINGSLLLPLHLGWWNFQAFNPPQIEPSFPNVMETLGARLIGWDAGISLTGGVDRKALQTTPLYRRAVEILRTCEDLRHANAFDEPTKSRLREPGREFTLARDGQGRTRFRPTQTQAQLVALAEPWSLSWTASNAYPSQPLNVRIEALMSAASLDHTNTTDLIPPAADGAWKVTQAKGVTFSRASSPKAHEPGWVLTASHDGATPRRGAWGRLTRRFDSLLNLKEQQALGLEIDGDGSGALLAIRLESPHHLAYGAVADRYVTIDFTGVRRFALIETEATRWSDYDWSDGKGLYNIYRETVRFDAIESVSVWLQNLPSARETRIRLARLRTLPMQTVRVQHPRLIVNGTSIEFPIALPSGAWIEASGPDHCIAFAPNGEPLGPVTPHGNWPTMSPGVNAISFSCNSATDATDATPRARITLFHVGDVL